MFRPTEEVTRHIIPAQPGYYVLEPVFDMGNRIPVAYARTPVIAWGIDVCVSKIRTRNGEEDQTVNKFCNPITVDFALNDSEEDQPIQLPNELGVYTCNQVFLTCDAWFEEVVKEAAAKEAKKCL